MKIPPWFWLVLLFILPLFAWVAAGIAAARANIKPIPLPPRDKPAAAAPAKPGH